MAVWQSAVIFTEVLSLALNNQGVNRSVSNKSVFSQTVRQLAANFFEHNVGKSAAALAYHLLFALFPLLVFVSNLLGLLELNVNAITEALQRILPNDIVGLVETYLDYVSHTSSRALFWFALVFSIWFPMRAVNGLMDDVRLAYQLKKPKHPISYMIRQLIYTILFLIIIVLTMLLTIMGENVLSYIINLLPKDTLQISNFLLSLWQYLRFLPVSLLMVLALGGLYAASMDERQPIRSLLPGIAASLFAWLAVSVGFSFYVENFANYSIIYGTLGAVIILMMWLYMTSLILILGAELNSARKMVKEKRNCIDDTALAE